MRTKGLFLSLLGLVVLLSGMTQEGKQSKSTQELLMSHQWVPIDMYDEDDEETCFFTYTLTEEIDSVTTEEGELEIYIGEYYLSDELEDEFKPAKLGKSTSGKYMIMNRSGNHDVIYTYREEIMEISETKLVLKRRTPGMTAYGRVFTFIPRELAEK